MTDIESLTASLVREYLSRKGLKQALQVMDQEMPRTQQSISNRAQLAKEAHIEKLMKKNKEQAVVYRTMLEVIVQYLREKGVTAMPSTSSTPQESQRPSSSVKLREKRSSSEKSKKVDKPPQPEEPDSNQDYSNLLHRLEKSETPAKASREILHTNTPISLNEKCFPSHTENISPNVSSPRIKSSRGRIRSAGLGGPVMSSGLGSTRDKRSGHIKNLTSDLSITGHKFQMDNVKSPDESSLKGTLTWGNLDHPQGSDHESPREKNTRKDYNTITIPGTSFASEDTNKKDKPSRPMSSVPRKITFKSQDNNNLINTERETHKSDELIFEDIDDDLDDSLGNLSLGSSHSIQADLDSKAISLEQAMALKNLIFGAATCCFNQEWRRQSFNFCDHYGLEYGIVQHKGGPCGVLAAVQAFVLKHLLFGEHRKPDSRQYLQPSPRERTKALASSVTDILWRAGENKSAIVALPTGFGNSNFIGAGRYKPDQLTENLMLRTFKSVDSLHGYVSQQIQQFEDKSSSGCILLLYSTILSRTIKRVISDMDDPSNKLMGAHGYCSQEMVNLLTTGKATSNAFDNTIELDSGGPNTVLLKGLEKQAEVGLLSLFEHYESCQVGTYYKTPRFPIWVICSESHFSVMFSTDRMLLDNWERKKKFDVYYYDGLSRQEEEIRLTIDTSQECPDSEDGDLVPPLEHVIRTRWKKAVVDWNGSEPIL